MLAKSLVLLAFLAATPGAYAAADLRTTIAASPASQQVYATTRYTVTVKNWGNKKASTNGVTIQLPPTHTSPQVYVLGTLVAKHANCSLVGTTTLDCTIPNLNANASSSVWFDLQLPVNAAPIVISAVADTQSAENSTTNNGAALTASQYYFGTTVNAAPSVTMNNQHCTGTGLTAWKECTYFSSSISSHQAVFHDDGSITIPGQPDYSGGWTVTATPQGSYLEFYYEEISSGVVAEFDGWGSSATCFEGLVTFPGSSYVSPYRVCPL